MDKLKTQILLISLILVLLFSVQSVAAVSDDDGNLTSESIDLSICDNTDDVKLSNNPNDILSASNELDVLGADEATYSELGREISNGGNTVELQNHYYIYDGSTSTININGDNRIIDGRGAVIDMAGSTIRAFYVVGSGVTIKNLTIKNANFNVDGGAIYFEDMGTVENCNFTNNSARSGGAIYFAYYSIGTVENCNFTGNKATGDYSFGGAIYFNREGSVENCNFTNNSAMYCGAVYFLDEGTVTNCNFTNNKATASNSLGGALFASNGNVTNCNFTNNSARYGGALFASNGNVTNCNFTNNKATGDRSYGGAVYFNSNGNVTNCNFTGNNATTGSAIYFDSPSATKTVSDSIFLNNRANAEALDVAKNDNNITIVFTGNDNLLNAIYSRNDAEVTFTNVTYWSANGIVNTGSSAVKPSRSNKEAGQNITLEIYGYDGSLVDNVTLVTDENGQAIRDLSELSRGKYKYNAYHPEDSYYTYAGKNDTFTNGMGDFNILQSLINRADADSVLTLDRNYTFTIGMDENLTDGIVIDKPITINGNGYTINALQKARIFNVTSDKVVLNNITFTNTTTSGDGGAVYFLDEGTVTNCNFTNNTASDWGGAIWMASGSVENCNFIGNNATYHGGAINFEGTGNVTNCNFTNNSAGYYGGAINFEGTGNVTNCNFTNNTASRDGGAIDFEGTGTVTNCNFTNNKATGDYGRGGAIWISFGSVENCNFTNNTASGSGGAIWMASGSVENCNFTNNTASGSGGAIYFAYSDNPSTVTNCNFVNNSATKYDGGAIYFNREGTVTNCNFTGNNATTGSAIYFWGTSATKTVSNSCFLNNRANAEVLEVTKNDNNITITFTGNDNLLNAIYSRNDAEVSFTNVTYWSANGIANTGSSTPARSNKEAGQNITVSILVNDKIVLTGVYLTNENGMIVLDISAGESYFIGVRHDTDSYYTEKVNTTSNNTKFNVNVTSQTTNNRTVNITAKSNIPNEVIKGKFLFILPNGTEITANYGGNGTWWAVHTFDDYGVYEVNASYTGLDNVTVNNGTVTINDVRLSVVKSADKTEVAYNSTVQFTINITNYGSTDATSVEVSDLLPEGLTFIEAGVISYDGRYEVVYSPGLLPDLVVPIDGKNHVTYIYGPNDIAQWNITGISGGNSVILLISARANGLVMGNITNEVTVRYQENETDTIVNSTNITVIPANSSVSAEDVEVTYGQSIVVVVSSENATGVSYKVIGADGVVKEGAVNVGENITGLDLGAGDYTVNLTTVVNGNYTSSNYTSKITVKPANSTVKAEDVEVTYGDSIVVVVSSENATGVSYKVIGADGVVKEGAVNVGESITGLDLAAGEYTVNLTTIVNANYTSANYTSKITVKPANSSVSAGDVEVVYGDSIVVVVSSENATGVSYKVIGKEGIVKEGTVNVGESITGLDLGAGEYTVNLTTIVNGNYTSSNYTSKITVKPANSTVKAEDVEVTYGDSIVVVVSSENATGVSYKIISSEGVVKEGAVNVGENITGLDLAAGEYTVNLTTIVNANYTSANYTSKITVKPANSSVSAGDVEVTYGEAIVIPVSVVNAVALYYDVVDKNNNIVVSDIILPGSNITVSDLAAGSYNVTLITGVDLNHTSVRNASKIIVKRAGSSVSAEDVTVNYGEAISIPVSSANATEISYTITDANDKAVANGTVKPDSPICVSDLAAGDYTVSLATVVDANHTSVSNSSKLHIRHVVTITIAPVTGHAGEVINFTAQFNYENGSMVNEGTASLTIKYEERKVLSASMYSVLSADESVPVSNGKATFNVKLGEPGRYPYVVSYSGSDVEDAQAESTLTILKANTNVSCSIVSGKPADKKNVTVTVLDQDNNPVANGTVTLTLNGKTYNSTVENGTAVLSVELPSPGVYNATVAYDGNDYYNSSSSSISVDVEKVNTNAPSVEDVSGMAGEKTDISVKFVDEYGNPVKNGTATLTIDGKTYTAEVINGTATFKDVVIPENDTVADVYYQGNDYYNASSATFSIKVKQNNTDENKTAKHVSSEIAEANATGNPIAMMLLALFVMVITYRKKTKL